MFVVHNPSILSVILQHRTCKCLWGQVFNWGQLKRNAAPLAVWVHFVQIYALNPSFQSSRVYRILSTSLHMSCFEELFKYKALFQILCQSNVSKHEDEIEDCVLFDLSGLEVQFQSSELWKHFRVTSLQMGIIFKSAKLLNDRTLGILKFFPHLCGAFEDQVYCGEESKTW